jgi:hypothetical protein
MAGEEECEHVLCRFHLLGELTRRPETEADAAMESRLRGEWTGTCALDYAETYENGAPDELLAKIFGIDKDRLVQVSAEARARIRRRLKQDSEQQCQYCGTSLEVDEYLNQDDGESFVVSCDACYPWK